MAAWLERLLSPDFWRALPARWRAWRTRHQQPISDREGLQRFIYTRAAHVAQTSLYGYLRARSGARFPELFQDDAFVQSINIAKWHVWLACAADLAVFAGAVVRRRSGAPGTEVGRLIQASMEALLAEAGVPEEAGPEFASHAGQVRARLALCDWSAPPEDEAAFSRSPDALVHWAPIVDELKQLDEEIVRNSVRFRWQAVRQELNRLIDAEALLASAREETPAPPREDAA